MEVHRIAHDQWPQSLVILFWPAESSMEHKDPCLSYDIFDAILSRTILMMSLYSTQGLSLVLGLEFQGEVFCGVDSIV
jgi:hypothetical protein